VKGLRELILFFRYFEGGGPFKRRGEVKYWKGAKSREKIPHRK